MKILNPLIAGGLLLLSACTRDCDAAGLATPPADSGSAGAQEVRAVGGQVLPGARPAPTELRERLWQAYEAQGPDYEPRSEHLEANGTPHYVNRLILEDSPYLIQHAHNPVDWYAWGEDAFEKARREDKPVFLSIGYSTCHWCHVMERESFDNVEVARYLNEHFVAIKVDREQRPDVDDIYMTAVQLLTGRGGWPMSSWLTPDGEPFFGGTYYPRDVFLNILQQVVQAWRDQRPEVVAQASRLAAAVKQVTAAAGEAAELGEEVLAAAVEQSLARHDPRLGGFSPAPKFPHEPELLFLLDRVLRMRGAKALAAVETSLDHMARGGIYDQVGGGFHRYSTDARWLVPHFEKMLYNQAHLSRAYLEAYRITGNRLYERVARQTLDYVLRDMTSPAGGFYSATDADSEDKEGEFFVWTPEQIRQVLPKEDGELAIALFGVTEGGNFEGRKTILHLPESLPAYAEANEIAREELFQRVDRIRRRLYEAREKRIHPLRDDKIVTAWNGMMITSLARAADHLGDESYRTAAVRAAELLWKTNRREDGSLWRVHLAGSSSVEGNLEDYAYLAEAYASLYDSTGQRRWLNRAVQLADAMLARFGDTENGGFFMSASDEDGRLIARPKSPTDGAIPSGNSVAVRALTLLAERTGEPEYRRKAEATLAAFSGQIRQRPSAFAYMLLGAGELADGHAGSLEYGARGVVRARAEVSSDGELTVELETADGWHINAHQPLQDFLIPTRLALTDQGSDGFQLTGVEYPPAETVRLGFQDEPLAVYQGRVPILARLAADEVRPPAIAPLSLTIQACDDQKCLAPEDLALEVPLATE
ncbi:MAG: thioredoxin domain-containing protein [Thermoanaerobaculia bacterium]